LEVAAHKENAVRISNAEINVQVISHAAIKKGRKIIRNHKTRYRMNKKMMNEMVILNKLFCDAVFYL
jgi:hypothetical protein